MARSAEGLKDSGACMAHKSLSAVGWTLESRDLQGFGDFDCLLLLPAAGPAQPICHMAPQHSAVHARGPEAIRGPQLVSLGRFDGISSPCLAVDGRNTESRPT